MRSDPNIKCLSLGKLGTLYVIRWKAVTTEEWQSGAANRFDLGEFKPPCSTDENGARGA